MLKNLFIKNVALIDEVRVSFLEGFNVFTGETGAGKSILIGSIGFLLGNKSDKSIIKSGSEYAKVEGLFEIDEDEVINSLFEEMGIESGEQILLSRVLRINNKSEFRINGEQVTMNMFKKVSSQLIDVFGQHDNQNLLNSANHIEYLDQYIANYVESQKNEIAALVLTYNEVSKKISELGGDERLRAREIELLSYEIKQIEDADLKENEDEALEARKKILINSEKIHNVLSAAVDSFSDKGNIVGVVKDITTGLSMISSFDNEIDNTKDRLQSVRWELEDIESTLSRLLNNVTYSEKELNEIEDRLDIIKELKRKYGNTIAEVLEYLNNAKLKVERLSNCEEEMKNLEMQLKKIKNDYYDIAFKLNNVRVAKAKQLESAIVKELVDLGMKSAKFCISIKFPSKEEFDQYSSIPKNGLDTIEFLFSANLGEELRPLDKIISGGELSRFSLAFKTILNLDDKNKTLIFDEVDTGIGGNTGSVVGKKILQISRKNQVLCITHLAQIASFADSHYKILKFESSDKTHTTINLLTENDRQSEITRMIGSIENHNFAQMHSRELIVEANNFKNKLK